MPAMPLDALAPDQRAVVQLVLQRDRSYAQIAELLKISEDAVRARAHAGLSALAPEVELPADKIAQIADFLLGQQNGKPRQSTRKLLRDDAAAREWAETVRGSLEDVGPCLSCPPPAGAETPVERASRPSPRPARGPCARAGGPVAATEPEETAAASSSRLGGAVLIGGAVLAIVVVVLALFVFKGDDNDKSPKSRAAASATATPTATPQQVGQIALKGTNGSKAAGRDDALHRAEPARVHAPGRQRAEEQEQRGLRRVVHDPRRRLAAARLRPAGDRQRPARDDRPAHRGPRQVPPLAREDADTAGCGQRQTALDDRAAGNSMRGRALLLHRLLLAIWRPVLGGPVRY